MSAKDRLRAVVDGLSDDEAAVFLVILQRRHGALELRRTVEAIQASSGLSEQAPGGSAACLPLPHEFPGRRRPAAV